jgi:hypothetical protein
VRSIIRELLPLLACLLGLDWARGEELATMVLADFDLYVAPALLAGRAPTLAIQDELAKACYQDRSTYSNKAKRWWPELEQCAALLAMLLPLRTSLGAHTFGLVEQLNSPIGLNATAAGTYEAEFGPAQRLIAPMLFTPELNLPLLVRPPADEHLDSQGLGKQLLEMSKMLRGVADNLRRADTTHAEHLLTSWGIKLEQLQRYALPPTLLVPLLSVGERLRGEIFTTLSADLDAMRELVGGVEQRDSRRGFERAVIEVEYKGKGPNARDLSEGQVRGINVWMMQRVPFDFGCRPKLLKYSLEHRSDHLVIHRQIDRRAAASMTEEESTFLQATSGTASFVLFGFQDEHGGAHLKEGVTAVELLAQNNNSKRCAERFGTSFAPSEARVTKEDSRSFARATRLFQHTALDLARSPRPVR